MPKINPKYIIVSGDKFFRLTAIKQPKNEPKHYWIFLCSCGNKKLISKYDVINGKIKSCGCLLSETTKNRMKTLLVTHGKRNTPFYSVWRSMKKRCTNTNAPYYKNYVGRGISVCKEWSDSFEKFYSDMYSEYEQHCKAHGKENTSLDRIDVNGNYEKSNCKFSTRKEQSINKRNTIKISAKNVLTGKEYKNVLLTFFCKEEGIPKSSIDYLLRNSSKVKTYKNIWKIFKEIW